MADLSDAVEALYADDASAIIAAYKGGGSSVKVSDGKLGAAPVGRLAWVEGEQQDADGKWTGRFQRNLNDMCARGTCGSEVDTTELQVLFHCPAHAPAPRRSACDRPPPFLPSSCRARCPRRTPPRAT